MVSGVPREALKKKPVEDISSMRRQLEIVVSKMKEIEDKEVVWQE